MRSSSRRTSQAEADGPAGSAALSTFQTKLDGRIIATPNVSVTFHLDFTPAQLPPRPAHHIHTCTRSRARKWCTIVHASTAHLCCKLFHTSTHFVNTFRRTHVHCTGGQDKNSCVMAHAHASFAERTCDVVLPAPAGHQGISPPTLVCSALILHVWRRQRAHGGPVGSKAAR